MLPIKLTAKTAPQQAAVKTHAVRPAALFAPWPVAAACARLTTKTHTLPRALARADAAAALIPQNAGPDWVDAFSAELGRAQSVSAAMAAKWATEYVQELDKLQAAPVTLLPGVTE